MRALFRGKAGKHRFSRPIRFGSLRWRFRGALVLATGALLGVSALGAASAIAESTPASPKAACAPTAPTDAAAAQLAAQCEVRVEVLEDRSETTQVFVEPSGKHTLEAYAVPQRVRKSDGSWPKISTKLQPSADGIVPEATTADVRFSAGGTAPLVTWRSGESLFSLSWPSGSTPTKPASLKPPRIVGDSAIYDDVFPDIPGVSLHMVATADGFRHTLEITTSDAAKKLASKEIRYLTAGNVRVEKSATGELRVLDAAGQTIAAGLGAWMWDSSTPSGAAPAALRRSLAPAAASGAAEDKSNASGPGAGAKSAEIAITVRPGEFAVKPDAAMLTASATVYPVFVDPRFDNLRTKWAWANETNRDRTDVTTARVGVNPTAGGGDGALYRSFFDFNVAAMRHAKVISADVTMNLDHSWSCTPTPVSLFRTGPIGTSGARIAWSATNMPNGSFMDAWSGNANETGKCPNGVQPDALAVFEGEGVRREAQEVATQGGGVLGVGLCACDSGGTNERVEARWKSFYVDKTYLEVTYDHLPYAPVAEPFSKTTDCHTVCSSPAVVRTKRPTLRAKVSDPNANSILDTFFEVRVAASETAATVANNIALDARVKTSAPGVAAWTVPVDLADGVTYYWRALSKDENALNGPMSDFYELKVDLTAPSPPSVASKEYPARAWGETVGTQGTFTVSGPDAAGYTWSMDDGLSEPVVGGSIPYKPTKDMVHVLKVFAVDSAGNRSANTEHHFWVKPVPQRCWNWRLDEKSGATAADKGNTDENDPVCVKTEATGTAAPRNGSMSGAVSFTPGYVDYAATFTGPGQIVTEGPVLDTSKSFSVMAWVRPTDLGAGDVQTALSQDGSKVSRFALGYRKDANGGAGGWCFSVRPSDAVDATPVRACAAGMDGTASHKPVAGEWVHLGGVFDADTNEVQLHVMGNPSRCSGEMVKATSTAKWVAGGSFVMGRGLLAGAAAESWRGSIDQVYAHQRVLSPLEICQQAQL